MTLAWVRKLERAEARATELERELAEWRNSIATEKLTWRAEEAEARAEQLETALRAIVPGKREGQYVVPLKADVPMVNEALRRAALDEGTT